ncbi:hypothetical protein GmHk_13G036522 [Glycine max]|nr:hypothetical protein GmHk_13G036522 [Glycine max]
MGFRRVLLKGPCPMKGLVTLWKSIWGLCRVLLRRPYLVKGHADVNLTRSGSFDTGYGVFG